jgi:hypothetical protein
MKCANCGREIPIENSNFCFYCGSYLKDDPTGAFRNRFEANNSFGLQKEDIQGDSDTIWKLKPEVMAGQDSGIKSDENGMANMFDDGMHNINSAKAGIGNTYTGDKNKSGDEEISFRQFFGLFALNFIPFIGTLLFLIMLIFWSADKYSGKTRRNFGKAMLLFVVIMIAVIAIEMGIMMNTPEYAALLKNYM